MQYSSKFTHKLFYTMSYTSIFAHFSFTMIVPIS